MSKPNNQESWEEMVYAIMEPLKCLNCNKSAKRCNDCDWEDVYSELVTFISGTFEKNVYSKELLSRAKDKISHYKNEKWRYKIAHDSWYRPNEIAEMGFILNSKNNGDKYFVLKLIKRGKLKANNYATDKNPFYRVSGRDIIKYKEKYE